MNHTTLAKVTAMITRPGANAPELLVFRHPHAGIQLPAGTVEADEPIEIALLREVQEETGLTQVQIKSCLDIQITNLDDNWRLVTQTTALRIGPAADAPELGFGLSRGCWVEQTDQVNGFAQVIYEEMDLNAEMPIPRVRISGWLPAAGLAHRLERHFFHLTLTAPTPDSWDVLSDGGHTFHLFWTPLIPRPQLVAGQNKWLDLICQQRQPQELPRQ